MAAAKAYLEADVPRVTCPDHGVTVAQVPWARHDAGHTRAFDDQVAWLAVECSKKAVTQLMRIAWRTVGAIIARVCADIDASTDRLEGLRRIGIDEISYRRGQKYLLVVVDHDTRRLVWAADGKDQATLHRFFDELGPDRCREITHVSADLATWIAAVVTDRCPDAIQCADPFHVVAWATEALDEVRREVWNSLRKAPGGSKRFSGRTNATGEARKVAHSRWALWKNPEDLTERQRTKLEWIAATHPQLFEAYRLKEGLRILFKIRGADAIALLDTWIAEATRSDLETFRTLAKRIAGVRDRIEATLTHGLSNALVEGTNTRIRLITRRAFGFHGPQPLIALAMLTLGGYRPALPGRPTHT